MDKRHWLVGIFVVTAALLSACASVPMASTSEDQSAKSFIVPQGQSNIYVYRSETLGAAVKMPVAIDGRLAGDTAAKTFILKTVEPGEHTIVSKTENDATLTITTEPGKNYFIWQEVKMGMWVARSKLHLVDEQKGEQAVRNCKLVK